MSFYFIGMKILASLRKGTKAGLSVWHFCVDNETQTAFAVGGEDLKVIQATDKVHLRQLYTNFLRYGYTPAKQKMFIDDPWSSDLSSQLQMELELLSA